MDRKILLKEYIKVVIDILEREHAIKTFIEESSDECVIVTIQDCKTLIKSSLPELEKENLIRSSTEIYFPALSMTSLEMADSFGSVFRRCCKPLTKRALILTSSALLRVI
ncbi:hypothetical protein RYX45_05890 [Alkalihalophilus pseudofirmus]|uniref:Uncharacterized protein n=1 Tax=Alkalihalophilus pseudofirmus TaxID=79885 RepID=A0AAJ2KWY5_ALKPS|nr:hypothetical protein [Alkalihalophilus pseudofirmus]MDV2884701.1 hypothetical protein [Alkalihalophilus pseudofirmus]